MILGHNSAGNPYFTYYCLVCGEGYNLKQARDRHLVRKHTQEERISGFLAYAVEQLEKADKHLITTA